MRQSRSHTPAQPLMWPRSKHISAPAPAGHTEAPMLSTRAGAAEFRPGRREEEGGSSPLSSRRRRNAMPDTPAAPLRGGGPAQPPTEGPGGALMPQVKTQHAGRGRYTARAGHSVTAAPPRCCPGSTPARPMEEARGSLGVPSFSRTFRRADGLTELPEPWARRGAPLDPALLGAVSSPRSPVSPESKQLPATGRSGVLRPGALKGSSAEAGEG